MLKDEYDSPTVDLLGNRDAEGVLVDADFARRIGVTVGENRTSLYRLPWLLGVFVDAEGEVDSISWTAVVSTLGMDRRNQGSIGV